MKSKASIKNIKLPDAPEPTRAVYKKPVIYNNPKHMRVIELPCKYKPKPAPLPARKPRPKKAPAQKQRVRPAHYFKNKPWTEDRIVKFIDLYDDGLKFSEIAEQMECSTKTAYMMASKLRDQGRITSLRCSAGAKPGWTKEQDQTLIRLYNEGVLYVDIAEAVGKALSTTAMRIQKYKDKGVLHERDIRKRNDPDDHIDGRDE